MLVSSLALTVSTCLSSGCSQLATSNQIDKIKQNANEIVMRALRDFDYGNYDLTFEEQQSFTKQKLYSYAEKNELFSVEELSYLKETITSDDDFINFKNVDNLFVRDNNSESNNLSKSIDVKTKKLYDDLEIFTIHDTVRINNKLVKNNFTKVYFDVGDINSSVSGNNNNETSATEPDETNSETIENKTGFELPILDCNTDNMSTSISGQVDGCNFFGLLCSKDACVNLYNTLAGWVNNQMVYQTSGSGSPFKIIAEAFRTLSTTTATGATLLTIVAGVIGTITGALSILWANFCALFSSGGPIGIIIGLVVGLIGAACIGTIAAMIVYGFLGKGFAIGWKIHHIFWWEWFCGELN